MTKILKVNDYDDAYNKAMELIENISNPLINESKYEKSTIGKILKELSKDLKFNISLITTYGTGIGFMIPIVDNLIKNSNIKIEPSLENLVLLTITVISITYLEETQNKSGDVVLKNGSKSLVSRKDAQTMLEELKLRGIGNGIVKKFTDCFKGIGKFLKSLLKATPYAVTGLINMLGYTSILFPCMNALSLFIGKYDLTIDNLLGNLLSVGVGVGAILAKQGVNWLVSKIKKGLNIKDTGNIDISIPAVTDIIDGETNITGSLIKEQ